MERKKEADAARIVVILDDYAGQNTSFLAQHGISLLIEVKSGQEYRRILMDTGQSGLPVLYNMELLGIQPSSIDAIVLSHCHYDHTKGLVETLKAIGKKDIPVIAHPDIFRPNYSFDSFIHNIGITRENGKEAIEAAGGVLMLTKEPFAIMPGVTTTGEVPRKRDFENQGIGTYNIEEGKIVPDEIRDDLSLIIKVAGKGIAVVSGCSHAGIVNIIDRSKEITKEDRVDVVIGGFHLIKASRERIEKTAAAFVDLDIHEIIAGHCTGMAALCEFSKTLGDRFKQLHVGTIVDL
ncbi:7,8-dihydropterin-6-yl-methyl-4-(beta-D-ribofuranosyl)aminobenzene 5'-phosphate synthase [Acetomicrobium thermoterrenum DSM 13490]|uniref:7,8-dihydropterin-6-yl-methyl-4-(Beta-D-ribofuranosyl)aminobenzene 5'-phosphate synthase n=1 Tax=Acetomicrobium thermoterrenum DSM 13490 TaxID=1120987 RepID=A0A1H3FCY1_9BACT|nr:MBL fold metallo-hydrolase [Acetomicrobium thermoterrenum]SDX88780.1 7,8-dihydropterin-6-yl-methyl-4-(beta-D-ribofuranosyl)aminobenzene 5'-phosphate synthase [Acetomicrobium thermoterrenum DSM 13490]